VWLCDVGYGFKYIANIVMFIVSFFYIIFLSVFLYHYVSILLVAYYNIAIFVSGNALQKLNQLPVLLKNSECIYTT
jgi:hypothetical protein